MAETVSEKCTACIACIRKAIQTASYRNTQDASARVQKIKDILEKFSLWVGNIGALNKAPSPLSLESRLNTETEVLSYTKQLLDDLVEVAREYLDDSEPQTHGTTIWIRQEDEALCEDLNDCIARLFRVSNLIRRASPADLFAKALSRNRYQFNEQVDIAHVAEKFPKLASGKSTWLWNRLSQLITQRRHYISYIKDYREQLEHPSDQVRGTSCAEATSAIYTKAITTEKSVTSAAVPPPRTAAEESERMSYTSMTTSTESGVESILASKIPQLSDLSSGPDGVSECPFCFRMKKFEHQKAFQQHVLSDIQAYVCTFPNCTSQPFTDINSWFRHEMENHRVEYKCRLCQYGSFRDQNHYLDHIKHKHPDVNAWGDLQAVLKIAQQPVIHLSAADCPCCWSWATRVRERVGYPLSTPDTEIYVDLQVFKRHLASHLEELALFAMPIIDVPSLESDCILDSAAETDLDQISIDSTTQVRPASQEYNSIERSDYKKAKIVPANSITKVTETHSYQTAKAGEESYEFHIDRRLKRGLPSSSSLASVKTRNCHECEASFSDETSLKKHVHTKHTRPFICVFHFAGCTADFASKNEWKRHVVSNHLYLEYYHCVVGECNTSRPPSTQYRCKTLPQYGSIFNRKDLFTQHVLRMHRASGSSSATPSDSETSIPELAQEARRIRCNLPENMSCPAYQCNERFLGGRAWDDRMEHVARHLEQAALELETKVSFGGLNDPSLTEWAESKEVNVIKCTSTGWILNNPVRQKVDNEDSGNEDS